MEISHGPRWGEWGAGGGKGGEIATLQLCVAEAVNTSTRLQLINSSAAE